MNGIRRYVFCLILLIIISENLNKKFLIIKIYQINFASVHANNYFSVLRKGGCKWILTNTNYYKNIWHYLVVLSSLSSLSKVKLQCILLIFFAVFMALFVLIAIGIFFLVYWWLINSNLHQALEQDIWFPPVLSL